MTLARTLPSTHSVQSSPLLLRSRDQACVVLATILTCGLFFGYWVHQGGLRGEVVDVDAVPRKTANFQVDINTANATELALLPDIGVTLAGRIVVWREEHGGFAQVDQLRKVKGIGPKKFESMRPFLLPILLPPNVQQQSLAARQ